MPKFSIKSDTPAMFSFMKSELPTGITLEPKLPIIESRDLLVSASIEFVVNIDVVRIAMDAALIYLISKGRKIGSKTYISIDGNDIPVDDPKAIELITNEIENKQND